LADSPKEAKYEHGEIVVRTMGGAEIRFNPSLNPRLAKGSPQQLANIELSPFGLHWPDLDEDLSIRGIQDGNFGQRRHN
jgi:hypothetical protein